MQALVWLCMVHSEQAGLALQDDLTYLSIKFKGKNLRLHSSKYGNCWQLTWNMLCEVWSSQSGVARIHNFWDIILCNWIRVPNVLHECSAFLFRVTKFKNNCFTLKMTALPSFKTGRTSSHDTAPAPFPTWLKFLWNLSSTYVALVQLPGKHLFF